MCQRRSHVSCNTHYEISHSSGSIAAWPQLILSRDLALMRISSYVVHYLATSLHASDFYAAPKLHYVTGRYRDI